jgi:hypothetical protein
VALPAATPGDSTVSDQQSSAPDINPGQAQSQKYFSFSDGLFSSFMLLVLVAVSYLGFSTYQEGSETEQTKRHAEQVVKWLEEAGKARAEGQSVSPEGLIV